MAEPTVVTDTMLSERWPLDPPEQEATKDERGRVLVVGGARSTPGAVLLAGLAALRVGAGKLTIATCAEYAATLGVAVPEAGVFALPTTAGGGIDPSAAGQVAELAANADAVLFGPGMTEPDNTRALIDGVVKSVDAAPTIVLDAMAATCGVLDNTAPGWVITPNVSEAEYLLDDADGEDFEIARRIADRYGVTTVLGDAVVTPEGQGFVVPKGNPGLGTSGSGDVLAGAVVGIAARRGDGLTAGVWGRALHGEAGDRLAARVGRVGFLARELLDELPGCLRDLTADRGM